MMTRALLAVVTVVVVGLGAAAHADLVPITGPNALAEHFGNDPFSPNETRPELQISGEGSTENSGGVAVFHSRQFVMDIGFLGSYANEKKRSFDDLVVTAAFDAAETWFDTIRFFDPDNPADSVEIACDEFIDASVFGLPLPPSGGIRGIGNGDAAFLGLGGALVAGVDLGRGLARDREADEPPVVRLGVELCHYIDGSKLRFDVLGLRHASPWIVYGNNPNSGAAGFQPEPTTGLLFGSATVLLALKRRRRKARL